MAIFNHYEKIRNTYSPLKVTLKVMNFAASINDTNTVFECHAGVMSLVEMIDLYVSRNSENLTDIQMEDIDYEIQLLADQSTDLFESYKLKIQEMAS